MRKFRFSLQRVLDYRETVEDKLLTELAAIRAQHERELARLVEITQARDQFREKMKQELADGDPEDIKQAYRYLSDMTRQVKLQEIAVRRTAERKDQKTAEVTRARKDRRVLERLRDYKLLEHKREAAANEQKFLDDIACIRHSRAKSQRRPATGGQA